MGGDAAVAKRGLDAPVYVAVERRRGRGPCRVVEHCGGGRWAAESRTRHCAGGVAALGHGPAAGANQRRCQALHLWANVNKKLPASRAHVASTRSASPTAPSSPK